MIGGVQADSYNVYFEWGNEGGIKFIVILAGEVI